MRFDCIISNPPFNTNIDLNILYDVYTLGNKICFIHPATWLFAKKPNNDYTEIKELVKNDLAHFEIVENSNKIFNIQIFVNCSINLFHKNHGTLNIENIDVHGDSEIYKSLKEKILTYCKINNLQYKRSFRCKKDWVVGIASIRAHPKPNPDIYTFLQKIKPEEHIGKKGRVKYWQKFNFDTEKECEHFVSYLILKLPRFCLSIYKINQHQDSGELASVPYMPTYEHSWTNKTVAEELGLTEEELMWAIKWVPNYYKEDYENN